ncbi:hypothetical protein OXX79_004134 [Metschnikowia pulcherrima]
MSQYQPNAAPGRSFIEKINSKFSSLSVSSSLHHHTDKDGSSEDDTLIHKAFVNYFESKGEPFPEWLGVKENTRTKRGSNSATTRNSESRFSPANGNSQFQPVRASYNSPELTQSSQSPSQAIHGRQNSVTDSEGEEKSYTRRQNSRLHALYNKSRQQSLPGSGYSSSGQISQQIPSGQPAASRSNSSGQRIRDRVMHGGSYSGESSKPTWGK